MTKKGLLKIIESGKFTMLYFYNHECGHCKQLTPKIKLFESVKANNLHPINTFKNEEISEMFKVDWVPVLMILKENKGYRYDGLDEIKKILS